MTPDYSVKRKKPPTIPIAIAGGIAGLAIVAAIVYFVMRGPSSSTGGSNSGSGVRLDLQWRFGKRPDVLRR